MLNRVHYSSLSLNWQTPKAAYAILDSEFHFTFDPCPTNPTFDGLSVEWKDSNFVNPPYGRVIGDWIRKGYDEYLKGKIVVFLIPSRTDTSWWHQYIMKATEIRFIRGRLQFLPQKSKRAHTNSAPFPSCIAIFKP
jgi:site-specific DNA-methyltransferase (adenine-specific)